MRIASQLRYLHLAYLSKPASDRVLFRTIWRRRVRSILQIGIGTGDRASRMISLAQRRTTGEAIRYVAIDLFEARPEGQPGLSLKEAHRRLKATGAQVQLVPGDPASALTRTANALAKIDLVLIACPHDEQSLAGAWFYVPRLLHDASIVYVETATGDSAMTTWKPLPTAEIQSRANAPRRRQAA